MPTFEPKEKKIMTAWRLTPVCRSQIREMSEELGVAQSHIIEKLIEDYYLTSDWRWQASNKQTEKLQQTVQN